MACACPLASTHPTTAPALLTSKGRVPFGALAGLAASASALVAYSLTTSSVACPLAACPPSVGAVAVGVGPPSVGCACAFALSAIVQPFRCWGRAGPARHR